MNTAKEDGVELAPIFARAKDAAKRLGISESLLWQWASERPGFPKPLRPSNRVTLFDVTAIAAHLKETASS